MNFGQVTCIVNLLQDINTLRPLVHLAAHKLNLSTRFLVTTAFRKRDKSGVWQYELNEIANETRSSVHDFENEFQALQVLQDGHGVLVAASESNLDAHKPTHDLFRVAPSQYVKITLQHGFECVGFLQSRDQNLAHGSNITFAADIICGWCASEQLTAVAPSQRHKLRVTGSTAILPYIIKKNSSFGVIQGALARPGLVCENMHSARLNVAGDFKSEFLDIFENFCAKLALEGRLVTLRPHPGGQYVIKNDVPLLPNVALENSPIYKVDLKQFAYGISAPSSILIDMVLAGIPTAVWQDEDGVMDLSNYEGLTRISTLNEWLIFAKDAIENREHYLEKQQTFLRKLELITNQTSVLQEFSALLLASVRHEYKAVISRVNCQRIILITPNVGATIQFGFIKPLAYAVANGNAIVEIIEEVELNAQLKAERALFFEGSEWLLERIKRFKPTLAIFCRWSGPHAKLMLDYFYRNNIPTILYLDDDLLNVPKNIGIDKWARYNEPRRLESLNHLLNHSDLIYASTNILKDRLEKLCAKPRVLAGKIISSHYRMNSPQIGKVKKIGYMGIGHEEDLEMVLGPLIKYLRKNAWVSFELFGTIPIPSGLLEFGDRISKVEKVADYDEFLSLLPCLEWDIGICPLTKIPFNFLKSNVKWIEYSSAGIPVIASGGTVYDECCAEGCGVLANTEQDWHDALEYLTCNADARLMMVQKAQKKLRRDYSQSRMRNQVLSMIQSAIQDRANETALINNSFATGILQERILFVAKSFLPTMEIYFTNPLRDLISDGIISVDFISENQIYSVERKKSAAINQIGMSDFSSAERLIIERFNSFSPSILVLVRYSGPHSELLVRLARARRIPIIYHIDDDLLNVPVSAGLEKQNFHNQPERLSVVRSLLKTSTLVFCSTKALMNQIMALEDSAPATTTQITCALNVQSGVRSGPVRKIGYMGGADHVNDFSTIVGALVLLLRKHTQITFEFFGGMQIPERLKEFGDRVKHIHPSINYEQFLARFSACEWDIGLCPLDKVHFNLMKTPIKWFDYTSIGAAVVATRGTVYDDVCAGNCGGLAGSEMEWFDVLDDLINNPSVRYLMAANAQNKLKQNYSVGSYKKEILNLFNQAHQLLQDHGPHKAAV